jgi:hypothetical protein
MGPVPSASAHPRTFAAQACRRAHQRRADALRRVDRVSGAWRDLCRRAAVQRLDERPVHAEPAQTGGLVEELAGARAQVENLEIALHSCRTIGAAVGIVMNTLKTTDQDAFTTLVRVSQRSHHKLRDVAEEVVYTGLVPDW